MKLLGIYSEWRFHWSAEFKGESDDKDRHQRLFKRLVNSKFHVEEKFLSISNAVLNTWLGEDICSRLSLRMAVFLSSFEFFTLSLSAKTFEYQNRLQLYPEDPNKEDVAMKEI